jgi:peptide/nickel transport system permease protein
VSDVALTGLDVAAPPHVEKRRRGVPPTIVLSLFFLVVVLFLALFGQMVAPYDASTIDFAAVNSTPDAAHLLGTDQLGRDILSRLLVGARSVLWGPALIAVGAMLLGNVLGLIGGYKGGWADTMIMRSTDAAYAFPGLLIAIIVTGILGSTYLVVIGILIVLFTPADVRIVRAATLAQRHLPYVEAARTLGVSPRRIMVRHIWPNVWPLTVAQLFLTFARALVALVALAFFGLGTDLTVPSWGLMLADGKQLTLVNPAASLAPAAAIVLLALAMNLLGDWSYERLSARGRTR